MLYRDEILDHYKHPHNFGVLSGATNTAHGTNPSCGDSVEIYLLVKDGIIEDVRFTGEGCALSTASASILTDFIKGKMVEDIKSVSEDILLGLLGEINPGRMKCVLLPLSALKSVLRVK